MIGEVSARDWSDWRSAIDDSGYIKWRRDINGGGNQWKIEKDYEMRERES